MSLQRKAVPLPALLLLFFTACGTPPVRPPSEPDVARLSAAELLARAEDLVFQPQSQLRTLEMSLGVLARNPDARLRLPRDLTVEATYRIAFDFSRGPVGGLQMQLVSMQPDMGDPIRVRDIHFSIKELVVECFDAFAPIPPVSTWSEQVATDSWERDFRKLTFQGTQDSEGNWLAAKSSQSVLYFDKQGLLRAYEYLGQAGVPHRFEYDWEPSQEEGRFRVQRWTEKLILPGEPGEQRRDYEVEYTKVDGLDLPSLVRLQVTPPGTEAGWSIEFRPGNYRFDRGKPVPSKRVSPQDIALLREAYEKIYPIRSRATLLEFNVRGELEVPPEDPARSRAEEVLFQLGYQLNFTVTPTMYDTFQILSAHPKPPASQLSPKASEVIRTWMPRVLEWVFEPVRGIRMAHLKVEKAERRPEETEVTVGDTDSDDRRTSLVFFFDAEGRLLRQKIFPQGGVMDLSFQWEEDSERNEWRARSIRLQQEFGDQGVYSYEWEISYETVEDLMLPSAVVLRERRPGAEPGVAVRMRLLDYRIFRQQGGWQTGLSKGRGSGGQALSEAEGSENELELLREAEARVYRIPNQGKGLTCRVEMEGENPSPDSPVRGGLRVKATFDLRAKFQREVPPGVSYEFTWLSLDTGIQLSPQVVEMVQNWSQRNLDILYCPLAGFERASRQIESVGTNAVTVLDSSQGRPVRLTFQFGEDRRIESMLLESGDMLDRRTYQWRELTGTRDLLVTAMKLEMLKRLPDGREEVAHRSDWRFDYANVDEVWVPTELVIVPAGPDTGPRMQYRFREYQIFR